MEEQLISFETAKLAKEKGFDFIDVHSYYHINEGYSIGYALCISEVNEQTDGCLLAPTQSLLQKWLREKHFLHIVLIPTITGDMTYKIVDIQCNPQYEIERPPYNDVCAYDFTTYEEALEIGLQEALKLI